MMEEYQWNPEELQALALLGLAITPHADASLGWGYTWQGRDWTGPFPAPAAAIQAALTEAQRALQFRSEYSWVLFAQPGERRQFNSESQGWVQLADEFGRVDEPRKAHPYWIDAADAEEQVHQSWCNDE